jgi:hypothetical protein
MPTLEEIQAQLFMLNTADKLFCGGEVKSLPKILQEDESIIYAVTGHSWGSNGLFLTTNKRLLFVDKQLFSAKTKEFSYSSITSLESDSGLALAKIIVRTSGGSFTIKGVKKNQSKPFIEAVRDKMSSTLDQDSTATENPTLSQLERLAKLREQGALTEDEFNQEKQALLAKR